MMELFDGYRHDSPTLRQSPTAGDCLGPTWRSKVAWLDASATIYSGDYVQLAVRYADGTVTWPIKRLEMTRDGRWWGICDEGCFVVGALVVPHEVVKVVALGDAPEGYVPARVKRAAGEEERAWFAKLAEPALAEWRELGYPPRQRWPGLDAVIRAARGE